MSGDARCRNPPYDTDLQKLVKEKEVQTRKKAPLFGHTMIKDAQHIWASIGGKWGGGRSAHVAYYAYAEHHQLVDKRKCDGPLELAVQNGEHDDRLKRAVAYAYHLHTSDWSKFWYRYVNLDVRTKAIDQRLRTLDPKNQKRVWRDELLAELAATKEELVGEKLTYDEDGSEHVVDEVNFLEGQGPEIYAFCVPKKKSAEFPDGGPWECSAAHARIWIAGGVVEAPEEEEEDEDEEVLLPVPEPRKRPSPPPTRAGKRAAAASAARGEGARRFNKQKRDKKAADDAAWKAEAKYDVEPDDAQWASWGPLFDVAKNDQRATTVDRRALRATIGSGTKLLRLGNVKTLLPRPLDAFPPGNPPMDGVVPEPEGCLTRVGLARFALAGDADLSKMKLVVDYLRERVDGLKFVGNFGDGKGARAWIAPDVMAGRRRANCTTIGFGRCSDGTLSSHKKAVLAFLAGAADEASGELEAALLWFIEFIKNCFATRTLDLELVLYGPGAEGNVHDDTEEALYHRGGVLVAGTIDLRAALSVGGDREMSIHDKRGHLVTLPRVTGTGVVFVAGAHTRQRGIVKHQNNAGAAPGATLIVTLRADVSSAFDRMTPVERLYAHAGIALF